MHSSASTGMQSRNQLHQVSERNSRTMVSLPSKVLLAQIWQVVSVPNGRMVVSVPSEMLLAEIWQIPKANGGMVVGLPSEELLAEIWHHPKKQLWQNCRGILCQSSAGKGNATKMVLTVEQNNWRLLLRSSHWLRLRISGRSGGLAIVVIKV